MIKSFGCSFIFGTDLADDGRELPFPTASQFTWPALAAKHLGEPYLCRARGGSGNLQILERVLREISTGEQALYIISWTWVERFDYEDNDPRRMPNEWKTICPITDSDAAKAYYKYLHSEYRDKLNTLIYIKTAVDALVAAGCPFVMTYMDDLIFDQQWHAPASVLYLQDAVRPHLHAFNGKSFLEWSKQQGFEISPALHPLEPAHQAGFELIWPVIEQAYHSLV